MLHDVTLLVVVSPPSLTRRETEAAESYSRSRRLSADPTPTMTRAIMLHDVTFTVSDTTTRLTRRETITVEARTGDEAEKVARRTAEGKFGLGTFLIVNIAPHTEDPADASGPVPNPLAGVEGAEYSEELMDPRQRYGQREGQYKPEDRAKQMADARAERNEGGLPDLYPMRSKEETPDGPSVPLPPPQQREPQAQMNEAPPPANPGTQPGQEQPHDNPVNPPEGAAPEPFAKPVHMPEPPHGDRNADPTDPKGKPVDDDETPAPQTLSRNPNRGKR